MSRLRVTSNAPTDKSNGPIDPGARCRPARAFKGAAGPPSQPRHPSPARWDPGAPRGPTARCSPVPPPPMDHVGGRVAARSSVLPCARKPSRTRPNPLTQPSGPFLLEEKAARAGGRIQVLPLPSRCFGKRCMWEKVPGISPRGAWIFLFKTTTTKKSINLNLIY